MSGTGCEYGSNELKVSRGYFVVLSAAPELVTSLPSSTPRVAPEAVSHLLNLFAIAFQDDDFKAVVVIQMNMCYCQHYGLGVVLHPRYLR